MQRASTAARFETVSSAELVGVERLRGTRMPWPDVVQIAGLLAAANGIDVVD